jgi:hypothetical protein
MHCHRGYKPFFEYLNECPAEKLREINQLIEREAWGGYRTEFYPTYDFRALYLEQSKNR